jgi:hypothetical protein
MASDKVDADPSHARPQRRDTMDRLRDRRRRQREVSTQDEQRGDGSQDVELTNSGGRSPGEKIPKRGKMS